MNESKPMPSAPEFVYAKGQTSTGPMVSLIAFNGCTKYVPAATLDSLLATLVKTRDWLQDPRLSTWPYMENGPFYDDLADMLKVINAAIDAARNSKG